MHRTDSNVPLFTAVWLAGNSHLKLPVFKQRFQIVRREVLGIFKATMVGNFCLAARFCAECNNFILGGDLGGDLGGTPQVSISFGIPNRCIEHKRFHTVLWLRQPRRFHDLVEPIYTLAKLLHIFVLMQELCNFRIAREMDVTHIVQPHDTGQRTGAFYRQPVVEHLDLDIRPFDAVIAVCNGVDRSGA